MLAGKNILLGVSGGIAAYKMANVASMLVKQHADVHVVMTENAAKFITPETFEVLTKNKVYLDTFDERPDDPVHVPHISLGTGADLILIAPATADIIGKIANGIADDMLSTVVLPARCPILICPSMNVYMLENPIGACFAQALEAGKATENSIIPINDLQALEIASNLNKSVADRLKDAAVNSIFENYKEWTNEWSDLVYKWQLEKYRKLKADNRDAQAWRLELAKTLLDNGKTIEEAVEIINQQHKGGTSDLGGKQSASSSAGTSASGGSSSIGSNASGTNGGNNGGGNGGGNNGGNDGDNNGDNDDAALFDSQIVIDHIKELYKNDKRGLPPEMIAEWTVYVVWGYHRIVNFKLNPDKKSYTETVILDGHERHVDKVDDPHIYVSFNGDDGWGVEKAVIIPLPKK